MPQSTTGKSPAKVQFGRLLRSQLDFLQADLHAKVQFRQQQMKGNRGQHAHQHQFSVGDLVLVCTSTGSRVYSLLHIITHVQLIGLHTYVHAH